MADMVRSNVSTIGPDSACATHSARPTLSPRQKEEEKKQQQVYTHPKKRIINHLIINQ
jgi:hypothetical protein